MSPALPGEVMRAERRATTPRAGAIAGILFAVTCAISLTLIVTTLTEVTADTGAWLERGTGRLSFAVGLLPFSGIFFQFFSTVFLGSGLLFLALLFAAVGVAATIVASHARSPDDSAGSSTYFFARDVVAQIFNVYALRMAAVFLFSQATLWLRTGVMPRWMAFLSIAVGLVLRTGAMQAVTLVTTFVFTLLMPLQYAVLLGIALSILLHVVRQSNRMTLKEWVIVPNQPLPREQDPPSEFSAGRATVLTPDGSTLYATARLMEDQLPVVTETTARSVVILNLRQYEQLGSTFLGMLERYAETLRAHDSKLLLAEVGPHLYEQLVRTGRLQTLKPRNVFRYTDTVGASVIEALDAAQEWIAARGAEGTAVSHDR